MAKQHGYLDYTVAAEYFNTNKLTARPITPDHFEVYSRYTSEIDRLQKIYEELRRRFRAKVGSYLRSITTWWSTPGIDPSYADLVEKCLLVLPVSELTEVLEDFPATSLRTEMVAVMPFYSAVERVCGFLIFNPRQTFYYTARQIGRGTGLGGCPNFVVPGVFNRLIDNYLIGFTTPQDYLSLLSSSICGVGKLPPIFLAYRGLGYCNGRKYVFSTTEAPATSRTLVIYVPQPDYHWYKYAISIGARTYVGGVSMRNATTCLQELINFSKAPETILHFINNTIKHRQPFSLPVNLSKTQEFARLASYYERIEGRFQALLNRDVALANVTVQVTESGIIYKNTYISNYIPALQVVTPTSHVFTVRAYGQNFDVSVPNASKKRMMASLPMAFLKQYPRVIIGHDPKFLRLLWELAVLIGDNQHIEHVPSITPDGIRLKYQILQPGRPPMSACTIPSAPEFVANYDTGYLTLNTQQEVQTARLALTLCGIPLMQLLGKTPYSLVILTDVFPRDLHEAFTQCGIDVILGHEPDRVLEQVVSRYAPGWPLVVASLQLPYEHILKHGPGVVLFRKPGLINPFVHNVMLVQIDPASVQADRLPKVFSSLLAWAIESYSDFKPSDTSITTFLYNMANAMEGPVGHKRSLREGFVYLRDPVAKVSGLKTRFHVLQKIISGLKFSITQDELAQYAEEVLPRNITETVLTKIRELGRSVEVLDELEVGREDQGEFPA